MIRRVLAAVLIALLWASPSFAVDACGVWAMKSGDVYATKFAGSQAGFSAALTYVGSSGIIQVYAGCAGISITGVPAGVTVFFNPGNRSVTYSPLTLSPAAGSAQWLGRPLTIVKPSGIASSIYDSFTDTSYPDATAGSDTSTAIWHLKATIANGAGFSNLTRGLAVDATNLSVANAPFYGAHVDVDGSTEGATSTSRVMDGVHTDVRASGTDGRWPVVNGVAATGQVQGGNTVVNLNGVSAGVVIGASSGLVDSATAVYARNQFSDSATVVAGVRIDAPILNSGASIRKNRGLWLRDQTGAADSTYAIYSEGGNSIHAGKLSLGTLSPPVATLDFAPASGSYQAVRSVFTDTAFPSGGTGTTGGVVQIGPTISNSSSGIGFTNVLGIFPTISNVLDATVHGAFGNTTASQDATSSVGSSLNGAVWRATTSGTSGIQWVQIAGNSGSVIHSSPDSVAIVSPLRSAFTLSNGSGRAATVDGVQAQGTITGTGKGGYVSMLHAYNTTGTGQPTWLAGLRIDNMTDGATNWAIASDGGKSYHVGNFAIGSTTAPTNALEVTGTTSTTALAISEGAIISGVYSPTRSAEANLDANVTMTQAQYMRVGNVVTVSGRFTADPTAAVATSFEMTLPVASNIGAVEDLAGTVACGGIASMSGVAIGSVANDTAVIQWIATDVASQTWSYTFTYRIL